MTELVQWKTHFKKFQWRFYFLLFGFLGSSGRIGPEVGPGRKWFVYS